MLMAALIGSFQFNKMMDTSIFTAALYIRRGIWRIGSGIQAAATVDWPGFASKVLKIRFAGDE
jgi:hypothetical protein